MTETVTARCNWTQTAGSELSQLIPTRLYDEDIFVKPHLDDVVSEESAVLFSRNELAGVPCELQLQISTRFKIAALTLVCSAPKVELFLGPTQEYLETIYGIAVEEEGDEVPVRPYRYDVEIDRSGIAEINLKLLTSWEEICIYGTMLHIAPNPNGITTQLQQPFDLQKIQELLHRGGTSGTADSPNKPEQNAEKMQKFMSLMRGLSSPPQTQGQQAFNADIDMKTLHQHLDARFDELQRSISKRLDEFEAQQTKKLDQIIAMLEKKN